ncbi:hypothetical protein [Streptomyces sp. NPDC086838]|uniref:hypothetical protein n=1 Tax=Streptomyces sp. NPDC086838 TaxID=3365762 RepID=UPI00380138BD
MGALEGGPEVHGADIGPVVVTATRTASAPGDPNAANDTAGAACTVLSIALANRA